MSISRLNQTLGLDCSDSASTVASVSKGEAFGLQPAHSALWFNREQDGHGLNVYMLEDNRIVTVWYVFDNSGNPIWLLGIGDHDGSKATMSVSRAQGGLFPPDFNTDDVNFSDWGTFELEFSGCDDGLFSWTPAEGSEFTAGQMTVTRLTRLDGVECAD